MATQPARTHVKGKDQLPSYLVPSMPRWDLGLSHLHKVTVQGPLTGWSVVYLERLLSP